MTDAATGMPPAAPGDAPAAPPGAKPPPKTASQGFCFTDAGCRTEVRLGSLLVLAAVFMWLWMGPERASWLYLLGAPLLLVGVPIQAIQASHRPGFPWKVGLSFTVLALAMWRGLTYRDGIAPEAPLQVQIIFYLLLIAGLWVLAWWPVAVLRKRASAKAEAA
jgi:hypothetical protein